MSKNDEPKTEHGGEASANNELLSGEWHLVVDPIDESMEELSAIAAAWQKNRDRKRPSPILRRALISAAQELVDDVEIYHKQQSDLAKASA